MTNHLQTWQNELTDKPQNYMPLYYHMHDIKIQIYTNEKKRNIKAGVALICPMWHLCNLAIYQHLLSQYGLWFTTTRVESTILHTQSEQTSHGVVLWLVSSLVFGRCVSNSKQFSCSLYLEKNPLKSNLYIRYINSIPSTRQTSSWVFFYLQSNMCRPVTSVVHIVDIPCHNQINWHFPVIGWKCDSTILRLKYQRLLLYVVRTLIWLVSWLSYLYCLGTPLSNYSTRSNKFHGNRCSNWYDYVLSFQYLVYILFGLCKTLCIYNDKDIQMKENLNKKHNTTMSE